MTLPMGPSVEHLTRPRDLRGVWRSRDAGDKGRCFDDADEDGGGINDGDDENADDADDDGDGDDDDGR